MMDLSDLTFVFPLRIYCEEQSSNLNSILSLLNQCFKTNIIVLEADNKQKYYSLQKNVEYYFICDLNPVLHKAIYVNRLIDLAPTPYIAVWNENAVAIPGDILEALKILRNNNCIMAVPYDGRVFLVNYALTNFFCQTLNYNILSDNTNPSLIPTLLKLLFRVI